MTMPEFTETVGASSRVVSDEMYISIQDQRGSIVTQYLPSQQVNSRFTRDLREISTCDLTLPPHLDLDRIPTIIPWAHRVSIYDDLDTLLWSGPVFDLEGTRQGITINAKDTAAWTTKTRNQITKRWDATDASVPAAALWETVVEMHNLHVTPIVRNDPEAEGLDFAIRRNEQMVSDTINQLTEEMDFRWTVVSGVPILGPLPTAPIASLGEHDFDGDGIKLKRDGSASANDTLLRGADFEQPGRVDMHGLNLQSIATVDTMFGVSNVNRALLQKLRNTAAIRDVIVVPPNSQLVPDAPVTLAQLMPSARLVVTAFGLRTLVELESVEVTNQNGTSTVRVSLESVREKIELDDMQTGLGTTLGGQRL